MPERAAAASISPPFRKHEAEPDAVVVTVVRVAQEQTTAITSRRPPSAIQVRGSSHAHEPIGLFGRGEPLEGLFFEPDQARA